MTYVHHKVVVMGPTSVGKSCITIQYVQNKFTECYDPTIEDWYRKVTNVDNEACLLEILDTAGTEELQSYYVTSGQGFVCVYDTTKRKSFSDIQKIAAQIKESRYDEKIPLILCGNKCDLKNDREVPLADGQQAAKTLNCPFFETSAKLGTNVENVFFELVREIRKSAAVEDEVAAKPRRFCVVL
jgi:GTPase KRas protein